MATGWGYNVGPRKSMSHVAHVAFKLLAGTAGALLLYGALFLYEDEHGKVQNTLEEWWIRLREKQTELLARHTVFMREVARLEKRVFDRLFGEKLISLRAIGVSQCYSLASTGFAVTLAYVVAAHYRPHYLSLFGMVGMVFVSAFTGFFLVLGTLRAFIRKPAPLAAWHVMVVVTVWLPIIGMGLLGSIFRVSALLSLALVISFACDVIFIAITRWAMQWSSTMDRFYRIALVVLLNCVLGLFLFLGPGLPFFLGLVPRLNTQNAFEWAESIPFAYLVGLEIAACNEIDVLVAFVFVALVLIMFAHRVFWPIINRPLYALEAAGIAKRHKLFGTAGLALLGYSGWEVPDLLKKIIEGLLASRLAA